MANPRVRNAGVLAALARLVGEWTGFAKDVVAPAHPAAASEPAPLRHPDVLFEHSDVNARGVLIAGAGVLVGMWIIVGLLYFYFAFLSHSGAAVSAPAPPLPPEPRLQQSPARDLKQLRIQEDGLLNHYTWVDQGKGVVGIPIERAIQLTAQRGIPAQKAPASLKLFEPRAGSRLTGFEGRVEAEPR